MFPIYSIQEKGIPIPEVIFTDEEVIVNLEYELNFVNLLNNTRIKIDEFGVKVPIKIKKVYETAVDIYEAEKRDFFLERF